MNKIIFWIGVILLSALFSTTPLSFVSNAYAQQSPNIIWIVAEDMSKFIPSFGDSTIKTPNLSRLAKEGIRFTNAYSTSGVCAPSRAALITGMYPTSIGANNMRVQGGYSKYIPSIIEPYSVVPPPDVKFYSEVLRKAGYYTINDGKADYQIETPVTAWNLENYSPGNQKSLWRSRPGDKPFFAAINIGTTHESQIWSRADDRLLVDPAEVSVPRLFPDTPIIRRDVARNYSNIKVMDRQVGEILEKLEEDKLLDNTIIFFFSDHGGPFPRYKRELYDTGLNVPLIVRFPNKRKAGTVNNELVSFVDFAPTLLSLAGVPIPNWMEGIAFLGDQKAEKSRKYIFAARDRMHADYDLIRAVKDNQYKYIRNYQPQKPFMREIDYRQQMPLMKELLRYNEQGKLIKKQMLWFRDTKPVEELYNTQEDPYELNNLAENPVYKSKLKELREALYKWERDTRDWGFTPEYQMVNMMWPDGKQPVTEPVRFSQEGKQGRLKISSPTKGSSIAYKIISTAEESSVKQKIEDNDWNIYVEPLQLSSNTIINAVAVRYGFQQSKIKTYVVP